MIKKNRLMIQIMVLFFLVFFGAYIPLTQRIPYLASLGYTSTQMNLIFSLQAAVGFVYQIVVGYLADKLKTIKKLFYTVQILGTIGIYLMFSFTQMQFFFHLIVIALISSLMSITIGLMDSWALELDPVIKDNYGAVRGMGTIGWIVGGYIVTEVLNRFGFNALGLTYTIISISMMLLSIQLRDVVKAQHAAPITLKDMKLLLLNKRYMLIVSILFFAFIIVNSDGLIVVLKMEALNASANEKYWRFALQALVELPVMFLGGYLMKKYKVHYLLAFGIIMYIIRFIAYAYANTATLMILASLLQVVSYPLLMITSKVLVFNESPEHLRSTGQMMAMSIYMGIGATVTPLLTAALIEFGGIDFTILSFGYSLIIPLFLIFLFSKLELN
jgi:MFS family permease